jgi:hypothetical protein
MVNYVTDMTLQEMWYLVCCLQQHGDSSLQIKGYPPGSLGQLLDYETSVTVPIYEIGSLMISCNYPTVKSSILVFKNGKMKVSGGLKMYDKSTTSLREWIKDEHIVPFVNKLELEAEISSMQINLINGGFKLSNLNPVTFFDICQKLKLDYPTIVLPSTMNQYSRPKCNGRICAVKIYPKGKPGPSLHFDHLGKVQLFAFRDEEHLEIEVNKLQSLCNAYYVR